MQLARAHTATPEQGTKEFRSSKNGYQKDKGDGLTGMMCKFMSQQSPRNVDIDMFDGNLLEVNYFISISEEMVESKIIDPRGN